MIHMTLTLMGKVITSVINYPDPKIDLTWRDFDVEFLYKRAGLITVNWGRWSFHLFTSPKFWKWGKHVHPYDLCLTEWACGPLFLLVRLN